MRKFTVMASGVYLILIGVIIGILMVGVIISLRFPGFKAPTQQNPYFALVFYLIIALSLIATGAGIIIKKNWARYSLLGVSFLTLLIGLLSIAISFLNLSIGARVSMTAKIIAMLFILLFFVAIPVFFLVFFNRRKTREMFLYTDGEIRKSARPFGITMISMMSFLVCVFTSGNMFMNNPPRVYLIAGTFMSGIALKIYYLLTSGVNFYIGLSFWKIKKEGWLVAVFYYYIFILIGLINIFTISQDVLSQIFCSMGACNSQISLGAFKALMALQTLISAGFLVYIIFKKNLFVTKLVLEKKVL